MTACKKCGGQPEHFVMLRVGAAPLHYYECSKCGLYTGSSTSRLRAAQNWEDSMTGRIEKRRGKRKFSFAF